MLLDLDDVGGQIDMLLHPGNKGTLAKIIAYPRQDLVTYVKQYHTRLFVFYGRGQPEKYDWDFFDRIGFVLVILVWSIMANSAVEAWVSRFNEEHGDDEE